MARPVDRAGADSPAQPEALPPGPELQPRAEHTALAAGLAAAQPAARLTESSAAADEPPAAASGTMGDGMADNGTTAAKHGRARSHRPEPERPGARCASTDQAGGGVVAGHARHQASRVRPVRGSRAPAPFLRVNPATIRSRPSRVRWRQKLHPPDAADAPLVPDDAGRATHRVVAPGGGHRCGDRRHGPAPGGGRRAAAHAGAAAVLVAAAARTERRRQAFRGRRVPAPVPLRHRLQSCRRPVRPCPDMKQAGCRRRSRDDRAGIQLERPEAVSRRLAQLSLAALRIRLPAEAHLPSLPQMAPPPDLASVVFPRGVRGVRGAARTIAGGRPCRTRWDPTPAPPVDYVRYQSSWSVKLGF